ncbi:MAG: hypothetical protein LBU62_05540 [Bacteroidales bacterium]|jgi:hypothetical protein|nr:hypothetical protein [Bacteroidales bacterium]
MQYKSFDKMGLFFLILMTVFTACSSPSKINYNIQVDDLGIVFDLSDDYVSLNDALQQHPWLEIFFNKNTIRRLQTPSDIHGFSNSLIFIDTTQHFTSITFNKGIHVPIRQKWLEEYSDILKQSVLLGDSTVKKVSWMERKIVENTKPRYLKIKIKAVYAEERILYITYYIINQKDSSVGIRVTHETEMDDMEEQVKRIIIQYHPVTGS